MENPFKIGTQNWLLMEELKKGAMYNYEIVKRVGCLAHTARTRDLRKHGINVITERVPDRKGVYISYLK